MMVDDEEEEFDAYTVLERAVRACDAEGIGPSLREGQRALAEIRIRAENAAMFEKVMNRLDELEEKITNIRENMPGYDTDGGGYSY